MKTRVFKYGEYYFPQYKGWFFWHSIFEASRNDLYGASAKYFKNKEAAIEFLEAGNWHKHQEVVWESKS